MPSEFGYLSVDGTVIGQILRSEIAVITYDGTAVLEALRTGAPFVWVIDQDFYPLRQSIIPTLKTIENSGVVHFSFSRCKNTFKIVMLINGGAQIGHANLLSFKINPWDYARVIRHWLDESIEFFHSR